MKLAALQMQAVSGNVETNLARIEAAAREASTNGADMLVVPELAVSGYGAAEAFHRLACEAVGPIPERLSTIARDNAIAVIAGFPERAAGSIYNSALFTDGKGSSVVYRKSHLYGDYERSWFRPDIPSSVLITVNGINLGMLICYDVEFPENVRRLAQAGADLVVVPTALPKGSSGLMIAEHMIRVRAFENQVFVAYINHCGTDGTFSYAGLSCIAAPDGAFLAQAPSEGERLLFATIRPQDFARSRSENTYLADLVRQI